MKDHLCLPLIKTSFFSCFWLRVIYHAWLKNTNNLFIYSELKCNYSFAFGRVGARHGYDLSFEDLKKAVETQVEGHSRGVCGTAILSLKAKSELPGHGPRSCGCVTPGTAPWNGAVAGQPREASRLGQPRPQIRTDTSGHSVSPSTALGH